VTLSLHPALAGIRAVVFDLDGVLYEDETPVPGAAETVAAIEAIGLPFRFLTNTTSKSRNVIAAKLNRLGLAATASQVFSPGHAAAHYLRRHGMSACLLVPSGALEEFDDVPANDESPDAVVVGDLANAWSYERLNHAFRLVHERGARLIGLGRSMYWRSARGLLLDVGPFLAALECATGQRALVFGKPERAIFDAVVGDLQLPAVQVAMISDDLEVDVLPAQAAGLRGVLVRTGKFRESDLQGEAVPDLVLRSVAEVIRNTDE
jgi:HAD superfamily hydrolase (TIGR01458 family)